jgi:hypothetical protein
LERERIESQWERDDATFKKLSDEELNRQKEAVLAERPGLRRFLADKDPRQSLMLRSLILERRMKKG